MRSILIILICFTATISLAQVRFGLQTGASSVTEQGFTSQLNTTVSLGWQFENRVSWGIQYGTTLRTKDNGNANFYYCDSFRYDGWTRRCVGNDSIVNSDFTKTYNINTLSVYILRHRNSDNQKFDLAGGVRVSPHFLTRNEKRVDELLAYDVTEKAIAVSTNALLRFSYIPFHKKNDFSIFIEGSTGIFISPQSVCDDANCDNFLENAFNSNTIVQIGISY